jgi:hypothetical protein
MATDCRIWLKSSVSHITPTHPRLTEAVLSIYLLAANLLEFIEQKNKKSYLV